MNLRKIVTSIAAGTYIFSLAACNSNSQSDQTDAVAISGQVVRAIDDMSPKNETSGKYMTGSFMTIRNSKSEDVILQGGSSTVAGMVEIHEVIDGEMIPMANGLVIPAKGEVKLRMGGYHVMLMELNKDLKPGDEVDFALKFSDGTVLDVTAPVKEIAMDDEVYGVEMAK